MREPATELMPGLVLVHGNRAEQLRDILVAWMQHDPLSPLENECLLVHSNGIAQWLRLALAQDDQGGIAAALDFLLPSRFMWQAYRSVLGAGAVPEDSPLDKDALIWRLMRLLPTVLDRPEYAVLQRFLADDADVRKRYQLAGRLADLFDQYQVYRADWLQAWSEGRTALPDGRGQSQELPATQAWQAHLWRALLDDLGMQAAGVVGRAATHESFMASVLSADAADRPAGLPRRILVFGISAMPRQTFEALAGLSRWVQILVCVHNPCAHYWADIQGDRDLLRARFRRQARRPGMPEVLDDTALHQQTHPLLASWGRQGRDYIGMLDDFDDPAQRARWDPLFAALHRRIDAFEELPGGSLLAQLQDDIRDLRPLSETRARWPTVDPLRDESIRFQVAHSAQREVEILQDQLLAAFQADPALQPRDVIVMVPDIEAYAPYIQAVFGLYGPRDWRHIPYALADRSSRRADPLVIVLEQLLSLPRLRLGINEVLEWLEVPALRQRFGIAAEDLPLLQTWAKESQVRWGLHAAHRATFELDQNPQAAHRHTWHFGLQRMLLGYAAGADAPAWQGIEPYDEPAGLQAAVLGGLAHFLDALDRYWQRLSESASPSQWGSCLQALLNDFFAPDQDADTLILSRFREGLQDWLQHCQAAGLQEPLPSGIVAEHCLAWLDQGGLSQRFFAGAVTFATLMPMRAIPFRRVCLLGMQDGAFPRIRPPSDMDLMATHPRPGDRSRREDDRYLFLEALLSAREQLSISWIGHSIQDNAEQPPSVLVAQLRDHLDRGWRSIQEGPLLSEALTCHHPLQPFSRRYFPRLPAAGPQGLFTYAVEWRTAQRDAEQAQTATMGTADLPPLRLSDAPLTLSRLSAFLAHPVRNFFQQRLQVSFQDASAALDEDEPYAHDALERWRLCQELLDAAVSAQRGVPAQDARRDSLTPSIWRAVDQGLRRQQRRGDLVDGALGRVAADALRSLLDQPLAAYVQACEDWPVQAEDPLRLQVSVPVLHDECRSVQDVLDGWRRNDQGDWCRVLLQAGHLVSTKNRYRFKALLGAWVEHVAAHLQGRSLTTVLISPKGQLVFAPLPPDAARTIWQDWWLCWQRGMQAALPIDANAAGAWLRSGADPQADSSACQAARDAYAQALERDLYLRRCYPDFDALSQDQRFFALARTLYGALSDSLPADTRKRATKGSAA
ncbi:exodeoxyribonuclease V subunit gamma [Castellaniella sp.]|uniref:exodeoxyribonuclease V subunit gamma n=1 Tax=Castellaniella sp. TaxID=1955812 RepID=UPI002AFF80EB|nr:exodeoxyribonuclease V subunit gamma [Castellaniella sp.]